MATTTKSKTAAAGYAMEGIDLDNLNDLLDFDIVVVENDQPRTMKLLDIDAGLAAMGALLNIEEDENGELVVTETDRLIALGSVEAYIGELAEERETAETEADVLARGWADMGPDGTIPATEPCNIPTDDGVDEDLEVIVTDEEDEMPHVNLGPRGTRNGRANG